MSSEQLSNLLRIGLLDAVPPSPELRARLLQAGQNRLADAALLAQGYRTSTSKPGHHQTSLQCLAHTLDVNQTEIRVLDGLRKQRNLSDYDGEPITHALLDECLEQAQNLLALVQAKWPRPE